MSFVNEPSNKGISLSIKDLLQYQLLAKQLHFPLQNTPSSNQHGDKQTRLKGRGMTFTDLRQYEKSDDVRLIDWRVTARLGKPHTRQYNEDKSQPFYLFVDYAPSMFFASKKQLKSVVATKLAATLMWQIHLHNEPIGLLANHPLSLNFLRPSSSQRHFYKCLNMVANASQFELDRLKAEQQENLAKGLHLLVSNIQSGSVVILISDFIYWSKGMLEFCHQLAQRSQLLLYCISDPIEKSNRLYSKHTSSLMFTDGTNTEQRLLERAVDIKNSFLENKAIQNYYRTSINTELPLKDQLIGRRQ